MKSYRLAFALVLAALGGLLVALPAVALDELFVANHLNNSVSVYSRSASDNSAPLRTLTGAATGLGGPAGLALDLTHNELIVLNSLNHSVTVYSLDASGNTAPLRTLSGAATGLSFPGGLALDLTNNELIVGNIGNASVTVYSRSASGNTAPLRTLSGAATGLSSPHGLALDLTNDELIVASTGNASVTVYTRIASGNTPAIRTLTGAATGLSPVALALDLTHNELFVTNISCGYCITVYSRTASGNTAPLRTLSGAATGLSDPVGLALDLTNNELLVANLTNDSVTVYSRTASGNTAPLQALSGAATGLSQPAGLAVGPGAPPPPPTALVAAVLPSSRSVQVGTTATAFATIINAGPNTAFAVGISLASAISANFTYHQTDCASNKPIGPVDNVPVDIGPGGQACYVIAITPTAPFAPTEVAFNFAGTNTNSVATLIAINTLLMSASLTPVPDIVALVATATNDGILHLPGPAGVGAFAVATVNVGIGGSITASANTGPIALPLALLICQTDPMIGVCISPIGPSVSVQINAGATPTFAIFATASGTIALDPATNRIFVVFADDGSIVRGRTSVAVSAQ